MRLDGLPLDGGGGGSPSTATFLWELVVDINFEEEADQALSGGTLTLTNQVNNASVVLAGQTVAVSGGALVMTAAASSNLTLTGSFTRTAALLGAALTTFWPDFDGHPIRFGAEVATPPTFDTFNRGWGVLAENAAGIGGGNLGGGFTAEIRATGAAAATRQSRNQNNGSNAVATVSNTAYAAGRVCGIGLDGKGPVFLSSLNAGDAGALDAITPLGGIGTPGSQNAGTTVAEISKVGVFAVASGAGSFSVSIKRLVLWARVARVA